MALSASDTQHKVMLSTSIQMLKQGLSCLCSAINTVSGGDGHRARSGRTETRSPSNILYTAVQPELHAYTFAYFMKF